MNFFTAEYAEDAEETTNESSQGNTQIFLGVLGGLGGEFYFVSRSTVFTGKSQCASRISKRRCSSRA
jgi:hypothetical protein